MSKNNFLFIDILRKRMINLRIIKLTTYFENDLRKYSFRKRPENCGDYH